MTPFYVNFGYLRYTDNTLAARQICTELAAYQDFANARARILQPIPATIPSLQNTCFFAHSDSAIWTILSHHDNSCRFIGTWLTGQHYHNKLILAQ